MCAKFKTTFRLPVIKVPVKFDSHRKREYVQSSPPNGFIQEFQNQTRKRSINQY